MIIISPWVERGMVDHTLADHTSTLAFIESIFGLHCLARDCRMSNLFEAFDFRPTVSYSSGLFTVVAGRYQNATVWVGWRNLNDQFVALKHSPIVDGSASIPIVFPTGSYRVVVIVLVNYVAIDPEFHYNMTL